ncbi:hypothetical protein PANDA_016212 [Ailuropoda melanoleuca]|uniref:Kinesin-like protein KIF6/9 C-terminal domain-containing protein n=1 Tax=Ailuropoda melanoleuca TaxID=9646 RepID=D2HV54_AILME|nr:hypothetical protein PANDA_016212 [Ailuropoda melanoleuca]
MSDEDSDCVLDHPCALLCVRGLLSTSLLSSEAPGHPRNSKAPATVIFQGSLQDARGKDSDGISENTAMPSKPDLLEEKLRSQLEEEKIRYKQMFMRLKALKVEIEHLQLLMDKAKVKLQKEFEAWWAEEATSLQVNSPAVNSFNHVKSFPQTPESQQERSQLVSDKSDVNARKILPSPYPLPQSREHSSTSTSLEGSTPERPASSVPLTGDSQTDSDILAFIKARQSILQKKYVSGVEPTQTLCSLPLAALTNPGPGCRGNARPECLLVPGTCPPVLGIDSRKRMLPHTPRCGGHPGGAGTTTPGPVLSLWRPGAASPGTSLGQLGLIFSLQFRFGTWPFSLVRIGSYRVAP